MIMNIKTARDAEYRVQIKQLHIIEGENFFYILLRE